MEYSLHSKNERWSLITGFVGELDVRCGEVAIALDYYRSQARQSASSGGFFFLGDMGCRLS